MSSSPELVELLSTPEARAEYDRIRKEPWADAMLSVGDPVLRRLGAKMVINALELLLSPERVEVAPAPGEERGRGRPRGTMLAGRGMRGTCSFCGENVSRRGDGTARKHPGLLKGDWCLGSGRPVHQDR